MERIGQHVALITIDRPDKANSLDPATLRALAEDFQQVAADDGIRCAVLTGAGDRVFCAGMDLKRTIVVARQLAAGERIDEADFEGLRSVSTATLAGFDLKTPLICAINGHARGAGFDLMLASELRYAVPSASFALEEVAIGQFPTGNAAVLLARQIGWVHAHDLLLTAKPIDAEQALRVGLITAIVEPGKRMDVALAKAEVIANNAPLAVAATRAAVRELLSMPLPEAYERQEQIGKQLRTTEDAREGQRAFADKRAPVFHGR